MGTLIWRFILVAIAYILGLFVGWWFRSNSEGRSTGIGALGTRTAGGSRGAQSSQNTATVRGRESERGVEQGIEGSPSAPDAMPSARQAVGVSNESATRASSHSTNSPSPTGESGQAGTSGMDRVSRKDDDPVWRTGTPNGHVAGQESPMRGAGVAGRDAGWGYERAGYARPGYDADPARADSSGGASPENASPETGRRPGEGAPGDWGPMRDEVAWRDPSTLVSRRRTDLNARLSNEQGRFDDASGTLRGATSRARTDADEASAFVHGGDARSNSSSARFDRVASGQTASTRPNLSFDESEQKDGRSSDSRTREPGDPSAADATGRTASKAAALGGAAFAAGGMSGGRFDALDDDSSASGDSSVSSTAYGLSSDAERSENEREDRRETFRTERSDLGGVGNDPASQATGAEGTETASGYRTSALSDPANALGDPASASDAQATDPSQSGDTKERAATAQGSQDPTPRDVPLSGGDASPSGGDPTFSGDQESGTAARSLLERGGTTQGLSGGADEDPRTDASAFTSPPDLAEGRNYSSADGAGADDGLRLRRATDRSGRGGEAEGLDSPDAMARDATRPDEDGETLPTTPASSSDGFEGGASDANGSSSGEFGRAGPSADEAERAEAERAEFERTETERAESDHVAPGLGGGSNNQPGGREDGQSGPELGSDSPSSGASNEGVGSKEGDHHGAPFVSGASDASDDGLNDLDLVRSGLDAPMSGAAGPLETPVGTGTDPSFASTPSVDGPSATESDTSAFAASTGDASADGSVRGVGESGTDGRGELASRANELAAEPSQGDMSGGGPSDDSTLSGASVPSGGADDLKRIRGIGPQNEERLRSIGVTRFAQIAAWTPEDEHEIGVRLAFPGRIEREQWVAQARSLAAGEATPFSTRVDAGEVRTSLDRDDPRYSEH